MLSELPGRLCWGNARLYLEARVRQVIIRLSPTLRVGDGKEARSVGRQVDEVGTTR